MRNFARGYQTEVALGAYIVVAIAANITVEPSFVRLYRPMTDIAICQDRQDDIAVVPKMR